MHKKRAVLLCLLLALSLFGQAVAANRCAMCSMALNERTRGWLKLADGSSYQACCPHCLFTLQKMLEKQGKKVLQLWVRDFDSRKELPSNQAYYVLKSKIIPCCIPSIIPFKEKSSAVTFQQDNGGRIMTLEQLLKAGV